MEKMLVLVLAVGFIVFTGLVVDAAPVGNIASPVAITGEAGLKITAEADLISERELDVSGESVDMEANFYTAKISYTFADRIDVYALLGSIGDAIVTEKVAGSTYKYYFDDDFAWGVGATALINEFDNGLRIGIDGKYRASEATLTSVDIDGTRYSNSELSVVDGYFKEWQVALGVSKEFGEEVKLVPYAGVKYSDVEVQAKATISGTVYKTEKVNSKDNIGLFAGVSFLPREDFSLNLEGRFMDEEAITISFDYKF